MSEPIRTIVIVGGGCTAWLAAATLAQVLSPLRIQVNVVEHEDDTVSDLATLPSLPLLHRAVGIAEPEFMRAAGATFKLGTEFVDWTGPASSYFHAHGQTGVALEGISFHLHWLRRGAGAAPLDEFALAAVAAKLGRFTFPAADQRSVLSTFDYGYHVDAPRYADFLRAYAGRLGATRLQGEFAEVLRNGETGAVEALLLKGGARIEGDLFIDCTAQGLLIAPHSGFEDWSQWFACDRTVDVRCEHQGPPFPFESATAKPAGWQWRIPLQGQMGNGYVYASRYISDDEATNALLASLGGKVIGEPRLHRFRPGRRTETWKGNVIALGAAAGTLEPLESTGLHLAQSALLRLTTLFPHKPCGPAEATEFNRLTTSEWDRARDFVLLHYAVAGRKDTSFWTANATMVLPPLLRRKIDMFRNRGHVILYDDETFETSSWASVYIGQGVLPRRIDPLLENVDPEQNARNLQRMRSMIRQAADSMPSHAAMLQKTGAMARRPI